jgi:hypothetical protein
VTLENVNASNNSVAGIFVPVSRKVVGRHGIGSNYFWYLRDPAGNFAEHMSDLDVIDDAEAWRVASSLPADGLAAWGPPVCRASSWRPRTSWPSRAAGGRSTRSTRSRAGSACPPPEADPGLATLDCGKRGDHSTGSSSG